jgi:hypothetical protein
MYIPSLFTTNPNGCPTGFNAYKMAGIATTNLNTGARGRITVNANKFTNDVVGENYQGNGSYVSNVILNNGISYQTEAIILPDGLFNDILNFWGPGDQNQTIDYYITSSAGQQLYYCYDCTKKWKWTIGSQACQSAPWPQFASPLTLAVLSNPTASYGNAASYTKGTFNFCAGTTSSIEGYGPIWYDGGGNNAPYYYIVSRENVSQTKYIIQNCNTNATASIALSGSGTLLTGDVFKAIGAGLTGSCWSVITSFQNELIPATYTNVITSSKFVDCDTCLGKIGTFDYLIVAGGGGGGSITGAGGGGGGLLSGSITLSGSSYSVSVGSGGAVDSNGQNSSIFSLTALGGGFGGYGSGSFATGSVGGSGGGGSSYSTTFSVSGSFGTSGQGNAGGAGRTTQGSNRSAGGGGGASQTGESILITSSANFAGDGGSGSQWVDGIFYAGGGGGSYDGITFEYRGGVGGIGGGGDGAQNLSRNAITGAVNRGGGGGGGVNTTTFSGSSGGSGIVKLRYISGSIVNASGGTINVSGSYVYHTFTGSGTFSFG